MRVIVEEKDCYCSLNNFYEKVAKKMGIAITDDIIFDCRKICVTKAVQDELWAYYYNEECLSNFQISALFLHAGPKANIQIPNQYIIEAENGFAMKREES